MIEMLVVVCIMAILAGLLMTVLPKAIASSRNTKCASNLRQLGMAVKLYSVDNDDQLPYQKDANGLMWIDQIAPYVGVKEGTVGAKPPSPYRCPACSYIGSWGNMSNYGKNYHINAYLTDTDASRNGYRFSKLSGDYILLADAICAANSPQGPASRDIGNVNNPPKADATTKYWIQARHTGRANILFCDFHVESLTTDQIGDVVSNTPPWTPGQR